MSQEQQTTNIGWINIKSKNGSWVVSGSFKNAQGVEMDLGYSISPSGRNAVKMLVAAAEEMGACLAGKGTKRKERNNNNNNNNNPPSEDDIPF